MDDATGGATLCAIMALAVLVTIWFGLLGPALGF